MNIAIIAPDKFDLQDLACVELGLRWPETGQPSIRAEPHNGEDGEIRWHDEGCDWHCEIQVKGRETSQLSIATLADYLAHFPERKAKNCLLDRLLDSPHRIALFVVSERCTDDTQALRAPPEWVGVLRKTKPDVEMAKKLQVALKYLSGAPARARRPLGKLQVNRCAHLAALAARSADDLANALQRVFIHESETAAGITVRIQQYLFAIGVPTDRLADGVARLKQVIADDRAARADVFQRLKTVLAEFAPERMSRAKYLLRGIEEALANDLANRRALLLSGPPRVGKSWTAFQLAGDLQKQGYEVATSSHIDQAVRFLSDPVRKQRAYVLEDPLGARQAVGDASARLSELRRLLGSLRDDRRLVIAQSEAPVLQAFRETSLNRCALGAYAWVRLSAMTAEQAETLWRRDAGEADLPQEAVERIASLVGRRPDLRDAGALAYLATSFDRLRAGASDNEIIAQARGDAVDFAQALSDEVPAAGEVLRALAAATEPSVGVTATELAFVLGGEAERPSLRHSLGITLGEPEVVTAPTYAATPLLSEAAKAAEVLLRRRRVIYQQSGRDNFVHPYLRAGAQALFRPDLPEDQEAATAFIERALSAVDEGVSLAAARNLDWVAGSLEQSEGGFLRAIMLAETGLRSLYPATRDACFAFLMTRAGDLPPDKRDRLNGWIRSVDLKLDQIEDAGGVYVVTSGVNALFSDPPVVPLTTVQPFIDAIEAGKPLTVDFALAYALLLATDQNPAALSAGLVDRLLSADAAVIRANASAMWLARNRSDDAELRKRIAEDAVPSVSNAILAAASRSWETLEPSRREAISAILQRHAATLGSGAILLSKLSLFHRVERFDGDPPWELFTQLVPAALAQAPSAVFQDGKLVAAIEAAITAGERESLIPLLETWATALSGRLADSIPDENELSLPEPLLSIGAPEWRWPILARLLSIPNTSARVRFIATLTDRWSALAEEEKSALCSVVKTPQEDSAWVRAAVLTRHSPPPELIEAATGTADALQLREEALVAALGENVFKACMHVYLGKPQPLWWLGSHHSRAEVWEETTLWTASHSRRPVFDVALDDTISRGEDRDLLTIMTGAHASDLPAFFDVMLAQKIQENGNFRPTVWTALLDRGAEAGLAEEWIRRMGEAAPSILDHLQEVREWMDEDRYARALLRAIPDDLAAY